MTKLDERDYVREVTEEEKGHMTMRNKMFPFALAACLACVSTAFGARKKTAVPTPDIKESDFCRVLEYVGVAVDEPGYHCWGTSPVMDDEGKVHLFVARYPSRTGLIDLVSYPRSFNAGWRHDSEIAHYVGDGPEGPFEFSDVAMRGTGEDTWDRYGYHNPCIQRVDGKYVLIFIANSCGITKGPTGNTGTQRTGMAVSDSPYGPWKKVGPDGGLILPRCEDRENWNYRGGGVNPAFSKNPNTGKYHLFFKGKGARMGLAIADKLEGPYVRQLEPISTSERRVEDGTAFVSGGKFYLLTTDNHGVNVRGGGLLWKSDDGITFDATPKIGYQSPKSYLPSSSNKGGWRKSYYGAGTFQRPQILLIDGRPTYLYVASGSSVTGGDGSLSYVLKANWGKSK